MRRSVDLALAYRLLNPGPMVLVSSLLQKRPGITPIAWHMPLSDEPPVIALEIWRDHFIHKAILETGDFVINIPPSDMAPIVRALGSVSGAAVDKFEKYGLKKEQAKQVRSPRLAAAIGILECTLHADQHLLRKYSVLLGDVVYAEAEESVFSDRWHPERSGPMIMHHLGGGAFCAPASLLSGDKTDS